MMKTLNQLAFDFRIKVGYTAAFILLLFSYILTLYGNNQLMKQTERVIHTNMVITHLESLLSGVKDAETALRGYIVTKDTSFLVTYENSMPFVDKNYNELHKDIKDNPIQLQNLTHLNTLIKKKYDILAFGIDYFPKNKYVVDDTLLKGAHLGNIIMDSIRYGVNKMQMHENVLLNLRTKEMDARYRSLNVIIITSIILAFVFAVFGFYTYRIEYDARLVADKRVNDAQAERQQRIEQLAAANSELILMKRSEKFAATGRIARTIAHEVRNPLTNIDLAVAQIKSEMPVVEGDNFLLFDMIVRNSKRINQLVSELLSATRFAELSYSSVSINTVLDEALILAKDRIELHKIKVEKKYSTDICNISADVDKVKIAFLNLIINAVEAMEPNTGVLHILTKGENNKCVVEITDNGHGMTEEQINKLFEPYFTTKPNGNGLGLTNTQNIILNHRGHIHVKSSPDEGTTFIIQFDFVS